MTLLGAGTDAGSSLFSSLYGNFRDQYARRRGISDVSIIFLWVGGLRPAMTNAIHCSQDETSAGPASRSLIQ